MVHPAGDNSYGTYKYINKDLGIINVRKSNKYGIGKDISAVIAV